MLGESASRHVSTHRVQTPIGRPAKIRRMSRRSVRADRGAGVALAARRGPLHAEPLALLVGHAQRVDAGARGLHVAQLAPALRLPGGSTSIVTVVAARFCRTRPHSTSVAPVVLDRERQPERLVGRLLLALVRAQPALEARVRVERRTRAAWGRRTSGTARTSARAGSRRPCARRSRGTPPAWGTRRPGCGPAATGCRTRSGRSAARAGARLALPARSSATLEPREHAERHVAPVRRHEPRALGGRVGVVRVAVGVERRRTSSPCGTCGSGTASAGRSPAGTRPSSCRAARSRRSGTCRRRWRAGLRGP